MSRLVEQVSAITPLNEAIDGSLKPKRRAPTKTKPKSESAGGPNFWVCKCGERFDHDGLAWKHIHTCEIAKRSFLNSMRKTNGYRLIAECGTSSGYNRHRDKGEPPCDTCRAARNAYKSRRYHAEDPLARALRLEWKREYNRRRRAEDPAYREREVARLRRLRARKKAEQQVAVR
jgi:hypothetical protein